MARAQSVDVDPWQGHSLRYANPLDGGWVMPMIAAWLSYLPKGFATQPYRATDNAGLVVSEGQVTVRIAGEAHELRPNDAMALPGWTRRTIEASEDAVLFFFSDPSAREKLGLWRAERGNA